MVAIAFGGNAFKEVEKTDSRKEKLNFPAVLDQISPMAGK
tara:strand:+ start:13058 stop:13177 length:120 start_codon:yes stop_codon:yes gene_type:complete